MKNYEVIKFKDGEFELDVSVSQEEDTVWLSLAQLSKLFDRDKSVISRHVSKIFLENALDEDMCVANLQHFIDSNSLTLESTRFNKKFYNLDVVIALAYQINSSRIEKFKLWALSFRHDEQNYKNINKIDNHYEIVKFIDGNITIDVNVSPLEKTVWMTQKEIANLFETTRNNISIHLKNIFSNHELEESVCKEILLTGKDNKKYLVKQYNLDAIIAVGYRVNTNRGILFRRWATSILENYILNGYSLNETRLLQNDACLSLLSNNINKINMQISQNTKDINKIKKVVFPKQVLIPNEKPFTSKSYVVDLLKTAKESIIIIDSYVDIKTLDILKYKPSETSLLIIASDNSKLSETELKSLASEYGDVKLIKSNIFHDRYLIIDGKNCYHLGSSLNYFGNKVSQIDQVDVYILKKLQDLIESLT